jgi:hypothetical protein
MGGFFFFFRWYIKCEGKRAKSHPTCPTIQSHTLGCRKEEEAKKNWRENTGNLFRSVFI